jgi:hypothetical protein
MAKPDADGEQERRTAFVQQTFILTAGILARKKSSAIQIMAARFQFFRD